MNKTRGGGQVYPLVDEPSSVVMIALLLLLVLALVLVSAPTEAAQLPTAQGVQDHALLDPAAHLELGFGKRRVTGADVQEKVAAPVRAALNDWAEVATALELNVAVPETAEALVLGTLSAKDMREVAGWLDETWELLAPVVRGDADRWSDATVVFVFDRKGSRSRAWAGILDAMVESRVMTPSTAGMLLNDPGGLTLRDAPAFLQPSWDMAGDAAAGDDEFRLGNEIANKFVQCLVTERFGQIPEMMRWGLGYVAEQRVFRSIYQFDGAGFVSSDSHAHWPKRTAKTIKSASRKDGFQLSKFALSSGAGLAETPQMVTWAALDYLAQEQPAELATLLSDLGVLHRAGRSWQNPGQYSGDGDGTAGAVGDLFDGIDAKRLLKHLKRVK